MEILKTSTLHTVRDGALAMMIDRALAQAQEDCVDRPALRKKRTVTIKITMEPHKDGIDDRGNLETVNIGFQVKPSIPDQVVSRSMKVTRRGLGFETDTDSTIPAEGQQGIPGIDSDPFEG